MTTLALLIVLTTSGYRMPVLLPAVDCQQIAEAITAGKVTTIEDATGEHTPTEAACLCLCEGEAS